MRKKPLVPKSARQRAYDLATARLRKRFRKQFDVYYAAECRKIGASAKPKVVKGIEREKLRIALQERRDAGEATREIAASIGRSYSFVFGLTSTPEHKRKPQKRA